MAALVEDLEGLAIELGMGETSKLGYKISEGLTRASKLLSSDEDHSALGSLCREIAKILVETVAVGHPAPPNFLEEVLTTVSGLECWSESQPIPGEIRELLEQILRRQASKGRRAIPDEKIQALFGTEAQDHLATLEELILTLEKSPEEQAIIEEIARRLHGFKGAAGMVGLGEAVDRIHRMESRALEWQQKDTAEGDIQPFLDEMLQGLDELKTRTAQVLGAHTKDRPLSSSPVRSGRHLVFEVAGDRYALPVDVLQRVTFFPPLTPLPPRVDGLLGLVNVAGQVIPVVDLYRILQVPGRNAEAPHGKQLLVTMSEGATLGLPVDNVGEVRSLEPEPVPEEQTHREGIIVGSSEDIFTRILLLDIDRLARNVRMRQFMG